MKGQIALSIRAFALAFLFAAVSQITRAADVDIGPMVADGSIFAKALNETSAFADERYAWVVKDKQMRFMGPQFKIGAVHMGETLMLLNNGKISGFRISVYNRGDDGAVDSARFAEMRADAEEALSAVAGSGGKAFSRRADRTKMTADVGGRKWQSAGASFSLEWALAKKGAELVPAPEYLRLDVAPLNGAPAGAAPKTSMMSAAGRANPRSHVTRESDGSVVLAGVPMVDQGQKGYCAAATVARIMGYYGLDFLDQHQIASWVETDADKGTNESMLMAMSRVLHDNYRLVYREVPNTVCNLFDLVKEYNKEAKREKSTEISLAPMPGTRVIDGAAVWRSLNPAILKKARAGDKTRNKSLFNAVRKSIDSGVPVVWSVMLGIVPETGLPQAFGGHMRMIIGYNAQKGEIIYTDSWGAGHERKTMSIEDAATITTGMRTIAPTLN